MNEFDSTDRSARLRADTRRFSCRYDQEENNAPEEPPPRRRSSLAASSNGEPARPALARSRSLGKMPELRSQRTLTKMRQQDFKNWHGEDAAVSFQEQVAAYKQQIRHVERYTRFVLHPGKRRRLKHCPHAPI